MANYDWWVAEHEHGKDACIRYKETTLIIFPQTMLSKRIEDGEQLNVSKLFRGLSKELKRIIKKNYKNA